MVGSGRQPRLSSSPRAAHREGSALASASHFGRARAGRCPGDPDRAVLVNVQVRCHALQSRGTRFAERHPLVLPGRILLEAEVLGPLDPRVEQRVGGRDDTGAGGLVSEDGPQRVCIEEARRGPSVSRRPRSH